MFDMGRIVIDPDGRSGTVDPRGLRETVSAGEVDRSEYAGIICESMLHVAGILPEPRKQPILRNVGNYGCDSPWKIDGAERAGVVEKAVRDIRVIDIAAHDYARPVDRERYRTAGSGNGEDLVLSSAKGESLAGASRTVEEDADHCPVSDARGKTSVRTGEVGGGKPEDVGCSCERRCRTGRRAGLLAHAVS